MCILLHKDSRKHVNPFISTLFLYISFLGSKKYPGIPNLRPMHGRLILIAVRKEFTHKRCLKYLPVHMHSSYLLFE